MTPPSVGSPPHPSVDALPPMTVRQVEYPSADGTTIGLFLVHRSDVAPGPDHPAILTGYGGFAIAETPVWSPTIAAWCATGGTYAIAGLRGGFEHGEEWHLAGRRGNKQNVFDDFAAAADWLVSTRDRSPATVWRSSAARTAGSSSVRRSRSGPICAGPCGAPCRCST